ncbi:MAG: hypothetical protein U0931_40545 [Vulcanimicrobiota bacterium]
MGSELKDDQPSGAAEENSTGKAKRNKALAEGKDMTYANGTVKDKAKIAGPTEVEVQSAAGAKTRRRTHSSKYKLQVLRKLDTLSPTERGIYLRKEGLYHSMVGRWRRELEDAQPAETPPAKEDTRALKRRIEQLEKKLAKADAVIDLQKKVLNLLDKMTEP